MALFSPQTDFFKLSIRLSKIETYTFYSITFLSIFFTIINLTTLGNILSILSIIILSVLKYITAYYQEKGESNRRNDFIDNSFGTKLSLDSSIGYYDNDEINNGLYKALVNLFENSYFSLQVTNVMKNKIIIKNVILLIILSISCIYGLSNSSLGLPLLQLFLSKYFIEDLIVLFNYNSKVETIFDNVKSIFDEGLFDKPDISSNIINGKVIKILIDYETNISNSKLLLDSKIFNQLNDELTSKWSAIKNKYSIK